MKVELSEVLNELEKCFGITSKNKSDFYPMYQRLKSLSSSDKSFEDGIIYSCARLIEMHDQPSMAYDIFRESGIEYDFNMHTVDVADRKYIRKMLKERR